MCIRPHFVGGFPTLPSDDPRKPYEPKKPHIDILVYTDSTVVNFEDRPDDPDVPAGFGLKLMHDLILELRPPIYDIKLDLLLREVDEGVATNKLSSHLLAKYDEVWFFPTLDRGSKETELTPPEIDSLRQWMTSGGVLITGDHSNPCSPNFGEIVVPAAATFQPLCNLGKMLGQRVPRAGELRAWDGPPAADPPGNYNTQVPVFPPQVLAPDGLLRQSFFPASSIESLRLQEDGIPQNLHLVLETLTHFHPLLHTTDGIVNVFPDHMHEGHIRIPEILGDDWPTVDGFQAKPKVIARGTDKRNGNIYDILAVYDGDRVGAGRIVADSTWHHYFNVNLRGFARSPDNSVISKIANYYSNLVWWLAPLKKRQQLAESAIWVMSWTDSMREVCGNSNQMVGATAAQLLGTYFNAGSIEEIVSWLLPNTPSMAGISIPHSFFLEFLGFLVNRNTGRLFGKNRDSFAEMIEHAKRRAADQLVTDYKTRLDEAESLSRLVAVY